MRIGLFTDQYYPFVSGVVTSIKMLYDGLTNLGHECYIVTSMAEDKIKDLEKQRKNVINIYGRPYPFKDLRDYRYTFSHRKYLKTIKNLNLDIIHVHTEYNISKLAILAHKKLHIPMVHTLHTLWSDYFKYVSPFFDKHFHKLMEKYLRKLFTGPVSKNSIIDIVPTKKVYDQSLKYGLNSDIRIIPTGIDLDKFNPKHFTNQQINDLKNKLGIKPNQFVFLYIGRASKEKNIITLLNSYAKACKGNFDTVFVLVGGGPQLEELKEYCKEL
ncbi:TPA: glycosyltransferase, partial [Candidatus Avacholeplasma faecigallinarum]|nr:glycosyltransferase [Candidatus Avacholeplasma faecigallinarum]